MSGAPQVLGGTLPPGERILWQGKPDWRILARRAFHIRKLAAYFAVLLLWYAASALGWDAAPRDAAAAILRMIGVALTPLLLVGAYAWLNSRVTTYTITDRRLVFSVGIALPMTINIPFSRVESADFVAWQDGHGNIVLKLAATERLAYLAMWPHARPWHMARAEPMLRCIPDVSRVAQLLARALAASAGVPVQARQPDAAAADRKPVSVLA